MAVEVKVRVCELCEDEAAVYCGADVAFLCWKCDKRVHEVNFLVARHIRTPVCNNVSSTSSSCVSSTNCVLEKQRTRRGSKEVKMGVKRELVRWCGEIGVGDADVIVSVASRIFVMVCGSGSGRGRRAWLAASFWLSLRVCKTASWERMRGLEEVSGVTQRLILDGQARIVRMLKDRRVLRGGGDVDREEGWAESC